MTATAATPGRSPRWPPGQRGDGRARPARAGRAPAADPRRDL